MRWRQLGRFGWALSLGAPPSNISLGVRRGGVDPAEEPKSLFRGVSRGAGVGTCARCGCAGVTALEVGAETAGSACAIGVAFAVGEPMRRARDSSMESARFARIERTWVGLRIGRLMRRSKAFVTRLQCLHRHALRRGFAKVRIFAVMPSQTIRAIHLCGSAPGWVNKAIAVRFALHATHRLFVHLRFRIPASRFECALCRRCRSSAIPRPFAGRNDPHLQLAWGSLARSS